MKRHDLEHVLRHVPDLIHHGGYRRARHRRAARRVVTVLFWIAWVWAVIPLVTLFAWALGLRRAYLEMFSRTRFEDLAFVLPRYALIVLMIALVFVNWATLQRYWWRGRERRQRPPDAPMPDVAQRFSVDAALLARARESRTVVVHHGEDGLPRAFESREQPVR